jgi:nitrite reductase/ring-hydroxylating ferredoxin subunit
MSLDEDLYGSIFPESWYAVLPSKGLAQTQIVPFEAFGEKWIAYRTASGLAQVTGRFCAHMGASFEAGRVRGERVVCPFHHWEYEGGVCAKIPYLVGGKIPPGARVKALPTVEHLGWVWVYNGAAPSHELPDLPEAHSRAFGRRDHSLWLDIHALLPIENACDPQHFKYVHKVNFVDYTVDMDPSTDHSMSFRVHQTLATPFGGTFTLTTGFRFVGASTIYGQILLGGRLLACFIAAPLPVSARRTLYHLMTFPRKLPLPVPGVEALYETVFGKLLVRGALDDYGPVWSKMDTKHRGALVAEDALQQRFRRYYQAHLPRERASLAAGRTGPLPVAAGT